MSDNAPVSDPNPDNLEPVEASVLLSDEPFKEPVAPVAPVTDEPAGPVSYEPTGDVGLDMALDFVGKAGISSAHPAMVAAKDGDFSILKATLAQKGTPGWEQFIALGEAAYARTQESNAAKQTALVSLVHTEAGGKEEWSAVQSWAKANATAEERGEINALLNQGGLAAKGAVKYLVAAYNKANNVTVTPRDGAAGAGRSAGYSDSNSPLSSRDYAAAVQALNLKLGGRLEGSKEYASLQARRAASR